MTKAHDFTLDAELDETTGWDLDDTTSDEEAGDFVSGYADEDDPELTTGEQDLAERYLLRRVAGLSTELQDISEVEPKQVISPAACHVVPDVSRSRSSRSTSVQPACARW